MEKYTLQIPPPPSLWSNDHIIGYGILAVIAIPYPDGRWELSLIAAIAVLIHLALWIVERRLYRRHVTEITIENDTLTLTHPPAWGKTPTRRSHPLHDYHAAVSYTRRETIEPAALCTALLPKAATTQPLILHMQNLPRGIRLKPAPVPQTTLQHAAALRTWLCRHSELADLGYAGKSSTADIHLHADKGAKP